MLQPAFAAEPLLRAPRIHRPCGRPSAPLPRPRMGRVARRANEFSSAEIVLGASAAIVTWVATGGNPGGLLGLGGERSLKRPDMAEKEVQIARQMFCRAAENYVDARESTGVLLNRMAPEIVQVAKQRLEGAIKTLQQAWREREISEGGQAVKAYLVPEYLRNAKEQGAFLIAVAGNQSVGKSSFLRGLLRYERVTAPTTTTEPVPYLFPVESDTSCMLWDLPPMPVGAPRDQYMAMVGLRHFDLVIVMVDTKFSETELLLLDELKYWKVPHVLVRTKLDLDIEREWRNEQLVWDARGLQDGLDEGLRAEILTDTLKSIKDDLVELCGVDRAYCISTKSEYQDLFDWPALEDDLRKTIHMRCTPSTPSTPSTPPDQRRPAQLQAELPFEAEQSKVDDSPHEAEQSPVDQIKSNSHAEYQDGWRKGTDWRATKESLEEELQK